MAEVAVKRMMRAGSAVPLKMEALVVRVGSVTLTEAAMLGPVEAEAAVSAEAEAEVEALDSWAFGAADGRQESEEFICINSEDNSLLLK